MNKAGTHFSYTGSCVNVFSFFSDKCPEMQLLSHMLVACLVIQESTKLFSRMVVPCSISKSDAWVIHYLAFLPAFGVVTIFYFTHTDKLIVRAHCGFNFPKNTWYWLPFHCLIFHLHIFFMSSAHFVLGQNCFVLFFTVELWVNFIYSRF